MAKIHGKDLAIYVDDVKIGDSTDCTLNVTQAFADATSKDDANWESVLAGMRSWTVSTNFIHDSSNSFETYDMVDLILNATKVEIVFSIGTDTNYFYGDAYASGTNISGPKDGSVSGDISFKGTGALNRAAIAFS